MRLWITVLLMLPMAGCARVPAPGPVALRNAQHMSDYLASAKKWKLRNVDDPVQFWTFDKDGTFVGWIEGESDADIQSLFASTIPSGTRKLTGKWQATTAELQLTEVGTATGKPVDPLTLGLKWVDGKLRIEIDGHHYMRQMQ